MSFLHDREFTPPWDAASWMVFDRAAMQANLAARLGNAGALLDLRSPILAALAPHLEDDWRRLGVSGFLVSALGLSELPATFCSNWSGYLVPPFQSSALAIAAQFGVTPIVSQVPEAIIWSNIAQQRGEELPLLIRWRGGDPMADSGPFGFLPLLEAIPGLPMISLQGFLCETPFASRHQADAFRRAIARAGLESSTPRLLAHEIGECPSRVTLQPLIDDGFLSFQESSSQPATFTVEARGVPVGYDADQLLIAIDLGIFQGMPSDTDIPVLVEGLPGRVFRLQSHSSLVSTTHRPETPSPWRVTLLGGSSESAVGPANWPEPVLRQFVADRVRTGPVFLATETSTEPLIKKQERRST